MRTKTTATKKGTTATARVDNSFESLSRDVWKRIKKGDYDSTLLGKATKLGTIISSQWTSLCRIDEKKALKAAVVAAEVLDYAGKSKEAASVVKRGEQIYQTLRNGGGSTPNHELIRERIRLSILWANSAYYREHNYSEDKVALTVLQKRLDEIKREDFRCAGTQGYLSYHAGKTARNLGDFRTAEKEFMRSIESYQERAKLKKEFWDRKGDYQRAVLEEKFCANKVAVVLGLGMGWIHSTRGQLHHALTSYIIPAQFMLKDTNDVFNKAYLLLLHGQILRALAGSNPEELSKAIELLNTSYKIFSAKGYDHQRYCSRAAYELALAFYYFHNQDQAQAEHYLREVESYAQNHGDHIWQANARILRSRIARKVGNRLEKGTQEDKRKHYSEAEQLANDAVTLCGGQPYCLEEALLVRAEARIKLGKHEDARSDLRQILEMNKDYPLNPRTQAVIYLDFSRSYAQTCDSGLAEDYFSRWASMSQDIEHKGIIELADKVEEAIDKLPSHFFIGGETDFEEALANKNLCYKEQNNRLRKFLIIQATGLAKGVTARRVEKIAKLLRVSKLTVKQWTDDYMKSPPEER